MSTNTNTNDDNQYHIVEDTPRMRSMQIRAPDASHMLIRPPSYSSKPSMVAKAPVQRIVTASPIPPEQAHEQQQDEWCLTSLCPVPPIYVLERTHVCVQNESLDTVTNRISDCWRMNSMAAVYHSNEVAAHVETSDHVQLTVHVWQATKSNGLLVEVQKVSGCGYAYCRAAKAILRAAKGIGQPSNSTTTTVPPRPVPQAPMARSSTIPPIPSRGLAREEVTSQSNESEQASSSEEEQDDSVDADTREGLSIATELLAQEQDDARLLALESLEQLSRATTQKCWVAKSILTNEIGRSLVELVETRAPPPRHEWSRETVADSPVQRMQDEFLTRKRRFALMVLSNCVQALEQSGELASLLLGEEGSLWTSPSVVMALVQEVSAASERPHEACQATHCLRALSTAVGTGNWVQKWGLSDILPQAQQVGALRHVELERACHKFRGTL